MTPTRRCASRGASGVVQFSAGNSVPGKDGPRQDRFFNRESFFVTHYDDVVVHAARRPLYGRSALPVDGRTAGADARDVRRNSGPLARSIISIDPPDHTRIRKLVQPSFTGRGMEAMRPEYPARSSMISSTGPSEKRTPAEKPRPNRRMELIGQFAYPSR